MAESQTARSAKVELLAPVTPVTAPFWDGLHAGELRLQRCSACASFQYPPETFCYGCGSTDLEWRTTSGRGTIYSFITVHQRYHPAFAEDLPYNVSIVELEEGPRLISNVIGVGPEAVQVGMAVQASPQRLSDEHSALYFEPAGAHARP